MEDGAAESCDSFCSAEENDENDDDQDGSSDDEGEDGECDDLEYIALDLVNVLPAEQLTRLLELLRIRGSGGAALNGSRAASELRRENKDLRSEVRSLRKQAASAQAEAAAEPAADLDACDPPSRVSSKRSEPRNKIADVSSEELKALELRARTAAQQERAALQADLERRVAEMAAERRGEVRNQLSEDLDEAAAETLEFLGDAEQASRELPKLLATLVQWLIWATRKELAPLGASSLISRVPEKTLQHAYGEALRLAEAQAGQTSSRMFSELPECSPHALMALEKLQDDAHAQRVGLACLALSSFSPATRHSLMEGKGAGFRSALGAAARRPRHPEVQQWALALIASTAGHLAKDSEGAWLAWEATATCAAAARGLSNVPGVMEHAAHALTCLLEAHPRRALAAARAKNMGRLLEEATCRYRRSDAGSGTLQRRLAEASVALERATAVEAGLGA